jgi:TolB-like protein/Flp pilus assembly protein TadD
MLAGGPPFTGGSQPAIVARHAADPMPSLRTVRGTVPAQVERVIETALAKAPNDRFATTTEFLQRLSDGLQTPPHPTAPAARPRRWQRTALVGGAAVLLTVAAAVLLRNGAPDDALPGRAPMLAVLPLENLGQPDDQYFAEGMTDEITTRLGQISGLSVISRTSALQYDLRTTPVAEVAQQLGVEWLLTGTIRTDRRSDGTGIVRVVPRLIRAADVRVTVWDGTFDAEVAPGAIFQAQAQIAEGVASELGIALQQQERAALQEQPTRDSAAYDAYLRGNNFAARPFAEAPTRRAIELFEEAARRDPNFLHAHAKLAEVESQYYYFFDRREARLQRVRAAVDRALELDSTHVAARLAYGYYLYWALSDFDRAIREFERIRQKQSNNSQLLYVLGSAYRRAGRWEDALASYERALTLNPRSQLIAADLGSTHLVLRNFADASRYLDRAIELAPDWTVPYAVRGHLYLSWHGDVERVRATLLEAADKGGYPALLSTLINRFRYLLSVADGALEDSLRGVTLQTMPLDSMSYYLAKAHWHGTRGRKGPQRAYYDSALAVGEGRVRARPDDADFHVDLGLAYAGLGRRADAEREVQRALQLLPSTRDAYFGQLIMGWGMVVYSETGNADSAVSLMRQALGAPSSLTPAMLRASPRYANLRGDRRFDSLAQIR